MSRLRIAIAASRLGEPLREVVRQCGQTGADGVQFDARHQLSPADLSDTGRRQLLHALGELNLSVASLTFPLRRPLHDQEQLEGRIDAVKKAMQLAWDLKARILVCRIGRVVDDAESTAAIRQREVLSELARHGNRVGVTVSITPSGDPPAALRSLLERINEGPLGIDHDPAERVMSQLDPVTSLRELHAWITHVTVRDGLRDADGAGRETVVGRGEVDWEQALATLDEMNYAGWLTADRRAGEQPLQDMSQAVAFIRRVAAA